MRALVRGQELTFPIVGPGTTFKLYISTSELPECEFGEPERLLDTDTVEIEERWDSLQKEACELKKRGRKMEVWALNPAGYISTQPICGFYLSQVQDWWTGMR